MILEEKKLYLRGEVKTSMFDETLKSFTGEGLIDVHIVQ